MHELKVCPLSTRITEKGEVIQRLNVKLAFVEVDVVKLRRTCKRSITYGEKKHSQSNQTFSTILTVLTQDLVHTVFMSW